MASSTPNYQFRKVVNSDSVNPVTDLDDNWDKVDQDMNRFDVQIFTASGTWNKPTRCKRVVVEVVGGGGSGGGAGTTGAGQAACAGGGGGGGFTKKTFLASTLASAETVTVGAGGAAATAGSNNGNTGGTSDFANGKAYAVTSTGGGGGVGMAAAAGPFSANPGTGGTGSGGDFSCIGSQGGIGIIIPTANVIPANYGGASGYGMGGLVSSAVNLATTTGTAGKLYGGGSSGAYVGASQTQQPSLAGGAGIVIVTHYY
jgi:hypothetical protein